MKNYNKRLFEFNLDIDDIDDVTLSRNLILDVNDNVVHHYDEFVNKYLLNSYNVSELETLLDDRDKTIINALQQQTAPYIVKPTDTNQLKIIIQRAIPLFGNEGNYNWINTSEITSMVCLFKNLENFNGDITKWETLNVINFSYTFMNCTSFNRDLSNWDISSARFMMSTFFNSGYTKDKLKKWNLSKVKCKTNIIK